MSVDTTPEQREPTGVSAVTAGPQAERQPIMGRLATSLRNIEWRHTILVAAIMAVVWCVLFLANNILQVLAGVVPVLAGLYLGRRVKGEYLGHGLVLGLSGFVIGTLLVLGYVGLNLAGLVPMPVLQLDPNAAPAPATPGGLLTLYFTFSVFALIPFPAFGTVMSGRAEERNRKLREEVAERGGQLERPGVIRTLEDLRGLSLPQLGSFVANLYRKKGFTFKDYRFIDKDKHLDLELEYQGSLYLLRLSVADKVRPGTIESLVQDMKRRNIPKGVAITSTEFTPDARKTAEGRRYLVAIDGQTLFEISEV